MNAYNFVNGVRTDTVNNLNYTKLIQDKLHIGLLNRNALQWGNGILIGIEYPTDDIDPDLVGIENIDLTNEDYYVNLFYDYPTGTMVSCNLWKIIRINSKWMLLENVSDIVKSNGPPFTYETYHTNYLDYRNAMNISDDNYVFDIFRTSTGTTRYNTTAAIPIRFKNSDRDFYNANKSVYLSPSGMGYPVTGFEDLVLLENSKDPTTIKLLNVPDATLSQINSGSIDLTGRRFDIVDSNTNGILVKSIIYDTVISLDNNTFLKFIYPTQNGDKVVLATNDVYENTYQIYPDFSVNLLTEIINDNLPPGIDSTQAVDNFLYESLFLMSSAISDGLTDLNFINDLGIITDVNFVSLANERNRLISGVNGYNLDNSVFVGLPYSVGNWNAIKENNLNKLLLNWKLTVNVGDEPETPATDMLWYDGTDLKIYGTKTYTNTYATSSIVALTATLTVVGQDLTDNIFVGSSITLAGCDEAGNNSANEVLTIEYVGGETVIVFTAAGTLVDETLDGLDETITITDSWIVIDNTVRQIGLFYIDDFGGGAEFIDLIYLTNINKISITDDMTVQLII